MQGRSSESVGPFSGSDAGGSFFSAMIISFIPPPPKKKSAAKNFPLGVSVFPLDQRHASFSSASTSTLPSLLLLLLHVSVAHLCLIPNGRAVCFRVEFFFFCFVCFFFACATSVTATVFVSSSLRPSRSRHSAFSTTSPAPRIRRGALPSWLNFQIRCNTRPASLSNTLRTQQHPPRQMLVYHLHHSRSVSISSAAKKKEKKREITFSRLLL